VGIDGEVGGGLVSKTYGHVSIGPSSTRCQTTARGELGEMVEIGATDGITASASSSRSGEGGADFGQKIEHFWDSDAAVADLLPGRCAGEADIAPQFGGSYGSCNDGRSSLSDQKMASLEVAVSGDRRRDTGPCTPSQGSEQTYPQGCKVLESNKELQFRVSLARNSLGVDTRPTDITVNQFATHLLAEVEQVSSAEKRAASVGMKGDVKLKAMEVDKGKGKGKDKLDGDEKQKPKCKFYLTDGGCRKGKECGFSHDVRDEKRRCYTCGSVDHFSPSCTRSRGPSSETSPTKPRMAKVEGTRDRPLERTLKLAAKPVQTVP